MEGQGGGVDGGKKKPTGGASTGSSISNDLFGPKGPSIYTTPSAEIFDSVFSHPSSYSRSEMIESWRNKEFENRTWKQQSAGNSSQTNEGQGQSAYNKGRSSIFQDGKVEPHSLSSSLYYGGQDVYSNPSDTRSSVSPHTYKKDNEDDDANGSNLHSASRGNWWQGGLYY